MAAAMTGFSKQALRRDAGAIAVFEPVAEPRERPAETALG
jgi:hypothetical protein